ncbi:MAG: TetR family transcriptional regulator [Desulfobacteraceae bacterium]|nr:TetR family transcriptional regulator [Desulfobacteraceae bacterium]
MDQLAHLSGFSISTLYDYLRSGILHPPLKKSPTKAFFDESHLARLQRIRYLREEKKLNLSQIKQEISLSEEIGKERPPKSPGVKNQIIDKALELFSRKNYRSTKISDITDELHMGSGTFYLYFKSKEELFLSCLDRLPKVLVPREAWDEVKKETDYLKRLRKRGYALLNAFPSYIGILNHARLALTGDDKKLAARAAESLRLLVAPLKKDLQLAIDAGLAREVDVDLTAYLLLGINETLGQRIITDPDYDIEKGFSAVEDFIAHALGVTSPPAPAAPPEKRRAQITDCSGNTIDLNNLHIRGEDYISGKYLEGELQVPLARIRAIGIRGSQGPTLAGVILKNGDLIELELNSSEEITGESCFGSFKVHAARVKQVMILT